MKKHPLVPYLVNTLICALPFIIVCLIGFTNFQGMQTFDETVGANLYNYGSPAFTEFVKGFTILGNNYSVILLAIIIALFSWFYSKNWHVGLWAATSILIGVGPLNTAIKHTVQRIRPEHLNHLIDQSGYSFPSGHAFGSVIIWSTLAFLLIYFFADSHDWLYYLAYILVPVMMIGLGGSRLYLGVHYPSDIIAGWSLAATWFSICLLYFRAFVSEKEVSLLKPSWKAKLSQKLHADKTQTDTQD